MKTLGLLKKHYFLRLLMLLIVIGATPSVFSAEVIERIVAIVNDEIITLSDKGTFRNRLKIGGLVDPTLVPSEEVKKALLADDEKLLQKMVDSKLLDGEVKRQNLAVTIEKIEQEIRNIAKKNNMTRDELKTALKSQGVAFSAYQDFIRTSVERQSLIGKLVVSKIKVSEDDVLAALASAHSDQPKAYEYTLAHIYFRSEKGGASAAKTRAETVLGRIKQGQSFDQLAAEHTEDPNFEQGGLLGVFKTGEIAKDLESSIIGLNVGDISNVLPTQGGFHIVRIVGKKVIPDPRWEKEKDKERARLYEIAFQRQLNAFVEQLRQDAFIRINRKNEST